MSDLLQQNAPASLGSYVKVIAPPSSWEGSGESDEDLHAYVGHIGVVVENTDDISCSLVRFPSVDAVNTNYPQRCIDYNCLELVSIVSHQLPDSCING